MPWDGDGSFRLRLSFQHLPTQNYASFIKLYKNTVVCLKFSRLCSFCIHKESQYILLCGTH